MLPVSGFSLHIKHKKEENKPMSLRNTLLSTVLLVGGTLGVIGLRPTLPVSAAGGYQNSGLPYLLASHFPPSVFHLSPAMQAQYRGQYTLRSIDQRTRLTSGTIQITTEPNGSMLGLASFYGYDKSGFQTNWLTVLYNFQPLPHRRMSIQLFTTTGEDLQDRLIVSRDARGNLTGQLTLDGQQYAINWQKTAAVAH
jgi:hypothetical protein